MKLVGSHSSKSSPFMMKVMTLYFVSDARNMMTALILVMSVLVWLALTVFFQSVVVEFSLQSHRYARKVLYPNGKWGCISFHYF
jgi:preprotein translocase subunit SecY